MGLGFGRRKTSTEGKKLPIMSEAGELPGRAVPPGRSTLLRHQPHGFSSSPPASRLPVPPFSLYLQHLAAEMHVPRSLLLRVSTLLSLFQRSSLSISWVTVSSCIKVPMTISSGPLSHSPLSAWHEPALCDAFRIYLFVICPLSLDLKRHAQRVQCKPGCIPTS